MRYVACVTVFFWTLTGWVVAASAADSPGLNLRECFVHARNSNPSLLGARRAVVEQEERLSSARKDFYPALSFQYSYTRQFDNPYAAFEPFFGPIDFLEDTYSYSLSMEQPLYTGKALTATARMRELQLDEARVGLDGTRQNLYLEVARAYFELLQAAQLERVANKSVQLLRSHLKNAQAFYAAGLIPKNDLLHSELQLAQGQQRLLSARNRTLLAESGLNILMGREPDAELRLAEEAAGNPQPPDWPTAVRTALAKRPELAQSRLGVELARQNTDLARSPFLPSVALVATYSRQGDEPLADNNPAGTSEIRTAQAIARWKFWSWGQGHHEVAAAMEQEAQAAQMVRAAKNGVILQVREAYLAMQRAAGNIEVSAKAVEQAEENFRINEARYQAHLNTSTDVLDAETLLSTAKTNYLNASYDYKLARIRLDWAMGVIDPETY